MAVFLLHTQSTVTIDKPLSLKLQKQTKTNISFEIKFSVFGSNIYLNCFTNLTFLRLRTFRSFLDHRGLVFLVLERLEFVGYNANLSIHYLSI